MHIFKKHRILSIVLCLIVVFFLPGCTRSDIIAGEGTTLRLALRDGSYADCIENSLPAFEEKYGITCEVVRFSEDDLHATLLADTPEEEAFDLCMADGSWAAQLMGNNLLTNLSKEGYIFDSDIIPATTRICYYNDSIYLAPYGGNVTVLLYNKELMKSCGYEENASLSLRDMLRLAEKAREMGKNGFLYRGDTENNLVVDFLPILLSHGGWVVDQSNRPTVNTPVFKTALTYYEELIATGTALGKADLIRSIDDGASCMAIAWPGWYVPGDDTACDYCALSGKLETNSVAFNANVYGIWMLGVPESAPHKDAAVMLLSHLMDPDVQHATLEIGGVPCRFSSLKDPDVLETYPQYDAVCRALQGGTYRPVMEEWTEFYTILGEELRLILSGEKNMDTGLADAQMRLEEALSGSDEPLDRGQ